MILSASSMESYMRYNYSPYHYFLRHAIFLVLGFILFCFMIIFPTKNYKKLDIFITGVIILALIGLPFLGHNAKNAVYHKKTKILFEYNENQMSTNSIKIESYKDIIKYINQ